MFWKLLSPGHTVASMAMKSQPHARNSWAGGREPSSAGRDFELSPFHWKMSGDDVWTMSGTDRSDARRRAVRSFALSLTSTGMARFEGDAERARIERTEQILRPARASKS